MTEPIGPERDGFEGSPERDGPAPDVSSGAEASGDASRLGDASRGGDASVPNDDPARTEPDADDSVRSEPDDDDPARIEPDAVDSARTDADAVDPVRSEPDADDPEAANEHVAAALAELDAAADRPPSDQVAAFTAAHETLQATLARIDDH
ncbi:MAG TPA: hypothetical protein VE132_07385 [Micromonosporaceae bacterium]|nr:hypothetical protein [Micromonosporaceae bacterium]